MFFLYYVGSGGKESNIFLEVPDSVVSHIEDLCNTLIEPTRSDLERRNNHEFVCQFKNPEYYLSRCFATLYPYGRGCPSDEDSESLSISKYTKHMLCLGGGPSPRRFQQSSNFIFTLYNMEMKRKIGGVAYVAQKRNLDGTVPEAEVAPNISDINNLLQYLTTESEGSFQSSHLLDSDPCNEVQSNLTQNRYDEKEMQKLIKRLIPYSQSLQGSVTHICHERSKLMAMIPSPVINILGMWRLFFTVAPADLYENRFYEVVQSPICENSIESWNLRTAKVFLSSVLFLHSFFTDNLFFLQALTLSVSTRLDLLRSHPALAARLFDIKQECIWKYILMGKAKPFGEITDYWRRVEVLLVCHLLMLYYIYDILIFCT
jgi:hypothetical protein